MANIIAIIALIVFSVSLWWPTRYLPFYGDAEAFVNQAANQLVQSQFIPWIAPGSDFAHPPLYPSILAFLKLLSPENLSILHLVQLPFLIIYLLSAYFILKKLSSTLLALCGAFILGFIPIVAVETGNLYLDLPASSLSLLAIALILYGYRYLSVISLLSSVFIKETALLYLPFFFIYHPPKMSRKHNLLVFFTIPLAYLIWLIYHYQVTGWLLFAPTSRIHDRYLQSVFELINTLSKILTVSLIQQSRFLILIPFIIALFLYPKIRLHLSLLLKSCLDAFLSILAAIFVFYLLATEFLSRYSLLLLPPIVIFFLVIWYLYLKNRFKSHFNLILLGYTLVVCFTFGLSWYPSSHTDTTYDFRPPSDLSYIDTIRVFSQAGAYLVRNFPTQPIYGTYPENFYFTDPSAGYVTKPLNLLTCDRFNQNQVIDAIIIVHPYSPGQIACRQLLSYLPNKLLTTFESGDKWLEVYYVKPTAP